jgi:hypothetical protein
MSDILKLSIKVSIFALLIVAIQVALISQITELPINLVFATIIAFASLLGLFENVLVSGIFCIACTMLVYDSFVFWIYPLLAIITHKVNPTHIADKLLVCIIAVFLLTPIIELFNPSSLSYIQKIVSALLFNLITTIPMYFIVKMIFYKRRQSLSFN